MRGAYRPVRTARCPQRARRAVRRPMARDILIVDDEADIRMLIGGILSDEGYQTRAAGDSASALAAVRTRQPNLVILDVWLEGSEPDGIDLLRNIREEHPHVPVVMISGPDNLETNTEERREGKE